MKTRFKYGQRVNIVNSGFLTNQSGVIINFRKSDNKYKIKLEHNCIWILEKNLELVFENINYKSSKSKFIDKTEVNKKEIDDEYKKVLDAYKNSKITPEEYQNFVRRDSKNHPDKYKFIEFSDTTLIVRKPGK